MSQLDQLRDSIENILNDLYDHIVVVDNGELCIPDPEAPILIRIWERELNAPQMDEFFEANKLSKFVTFILAPMLVNVPASTELFKWVATEGQKFNLGHFRIQPSDESQSNFSLIFECVIAGDIISPEQFKTVLLAVQLAALDNFENLSQSFGGIPYADHFLENLPDNN